MDEVSIDAQQTIENYMFLVNSSFLLEPRRADNNWKFEYMNGIQFPGLWSRCLYDDATRNQMYRNMLVVNRPTPFGVDRDKEWPWQQTLTNIRMLMNRLIPATDNSLLSEYTTNLPYTLNFYENEDVTEPAPLNSSRDIETWTKSVPGGVGYDLDADNLILPSFLGTPCGITFLSRLRLHALHRRWDIQAATWFAG